MVSWQQPGAVYPSAWQAFPVTAAIGALAARRQRALGGQSEVGALMLVILVSTYGRVRF